MLDNFATIEATVNELQKENFIVFTAEVPGNAGGLATMHLAVSDASGDNAIFEYIGGKLKIHHSPTDQVMTNSPAYDIQLGLNEYWKQIGGTT